jgi:hypothetical protein
MRTNVTLALALALLAPPARAQLSNRVVSLEAGISPAGAGARPALALAAGAWIDGDVEGFARIAAGAVPRTGGRVADSVLGAAGLRLWLGNAPLRPFVAAELGWVRRLAWAGGDAVFAGAAAGIEAFVARDLALSVRSTARLAAGGRTWLDATAGLALYF